MRLRLLFCLSLAMLVSFAFTTIGLAAAAPGGSGGEGSKSTSQEYRVIAQRPDRLFVQLPNGLLVIVQELHSAPVVSAQVWVKTGSIYEQQHVGAGLSHFLEHLLSGGTTSTRTEAESNAILGKIGAQTNAATGLETVNYHINTTSDHAATAVGLLSDWMQHSLINPDEYDRERQVIQREFEHGQGSPARIFWKLTQQARYQVHPARHPTIGYLAEFLKVSRDEIYAFYKKMYVPNNMVFVVVGDVSKEAIVKQIAGLWQDAKPGKLPQLTLPIEPALEHPRKLSGHAAIDQPRLRLAWPGTKLGAEHDYALDLLANILGGGESSRLPRTVRDQAHAVNAISAYNLSFDWGQGFFGIDSTITVSPAANAADLKMKHEDRITNALEQAKDQILKQVHQVVKEGVSPQELDRARRQQIASSVYSSQTDQAIAARMARDLIGMGDPDYQDHYNKALKAVTTQDVQAAAKAILQDKRLITISLLPEAQGQVPSGLTRPPEPDVKFKTHPVHLDNSVLLARYEKLHPHQAKVQQRSAVEVDDLEVHTLSNGLRVIIQRSTLVPAVSLQLYQLGGLLGDEPGKEGVANAAATMLTRGTQHLNAQEIASQIDDLGAMLAPACGNNTFYIRGVALKADWEKILKLMADITLRPSFPQAEWDNMKPRLLAAIDRQNDSWGNELRNRFRQSYFATDYPWSQSVMGRRDVVAGLTAKDLSAYYYDRLDASKTVLVIIGDVDPAKVLAQVKAEFATLPAHAVTPFVAKAADAPHPGIYEYHTNKPMVAVEIGYGPGPDRHSPDFAGVSVLTKVLSDFPTGWLEQELRGKGPGLVYAVGAGQSTGVVPGYLAALFNTQPSTAIEALKRASSVFERARNTVVDETTLARAKAAVLTEEFFYKQSNGDRAADAALNELYGLGLDATKKFQAQVDLLSAKDLQVIAQTYLRQPVTVLITHQPLKAQELIQAAASSSVKPLKVVHKETAPDTKSEATKQE